MKKLLEQASLVDALHDALARAIDSGLETDRLCSLARKPAELARAKQAEELRATLFPGGMAVVNASWVAEAGNTERVEALLERQPELAAFLEEVPVRGGTLLALVKRWITAGKKLGKLERDRAALAAKEATTPRDGTALTRLRMEWIGLVTMAIIRTPRRHDEQLAPSTPILTSAC